MSTTTLQTRDAIHTWLAAQFGHSFQYWECDSREIFVYQANTRTGRFTRQTNLNYDLVGQIGSVVTASFANGTATFRSVSRRGGKNETLTSVLTRVSPQNGPVAYTLTTHFTFTESQYLANMSAIRRTNDYRIAVDRLSAKGLPATDANVAREMATAVYTCVEDVPTINPSSLKMDIFWQHSTKGPVVSALVRTADNAVFPVTPQVIRFWFRCTEDIPGFPGSKSFAGEYTTGSASVRVSTDLRDREALVLLSPKNVEVTCQMMFKQRDGQMQSVLGTNMFSFPLSEFAYWT